MVSFFDGTYVFDAANEPAVELHRREGFLMQGGKPDMFVIDGVSLGELWMARRVTG